MQRPDPPAVSDNPADPVNRAGLSAAGGAASLPDPSAAPQLRTFLLVSCLGWMGFALHYALVGRPRTALLDALVALGTLQLWRLSRGPRGASRSALIGHASAGLSAVGLVGAAWLSGRGASGVIWYFACLPMFAAYLRGVRAALGWMAASLGCIAALHLSERLIEVEPEFLLRGAEAMLSQMALTAIVLAFAISARLFASRQIAELREREAVIGKQASRLRRQTEELAVARDEALAAARLKSAFLANMSHEIRTPLNAVIGMSSLLEGSALSDEQQDCVHSIHQSGEALLTLLSDILDFSKIEAGRLEPENAAFDPRQCIEEAIDMVTPQARARRLALAYIVDESVPPVVVSDPGRLKQILVNLLSNAIKFTPAGHVLIRARSAPGPDGAPGVRFAVHDTGMGIPRDRRDRLFKPFSQVDASTTREFGGTGLGLAISHSLCGLLGGSMEVESEVGRGSTFSFAIRAGDRDDACAAPGGDGPGELSGRRLLIADGASIVGEALGAQLRQWGALPVLAGSGQQALGWLEAPGERFDALLFDPSLTTPEGLDLGRAILARPGLSELPLVALHAGADRAPSEAERPGPRLAAAVTKPVKQQALRAALRAALTGQRASASPSGSPLPARAEGPLRVLLAEDNPMNQKVARLMLGRLGHGPDVVRTGVEALEALGKKPYDVVLLDLQMPEMDGLETARQIASRWPPGGRPRLIAMTANALPGDRERCLSAGMDDYLSKPVAMPALERALRGVPRLDAPAPPGPGASGAVGPPIAGAALDAVTVAGLRELGALTGTNLLGEMIDIFLESVPAQLAGAAAALASGDAGELAFLAHTLKGSCGSLGVRRMHALAAQLELAASSNRIDQAGALVPSLGEEFESAQRAMHKIRGSPA